MHDTPPDLHPHYRYLDFMSPLSHRRANDLVRFMAIRAHGQVIDFGCGWASLLIRLLEANEHIVGIGIDLKDGGNFEHARRAAESRSVADRLTLIAGDAKAHACPESHGAICIGASQIWGTPTTLDYRTALQALRAVVRPGAPVVYGEAIWTAPPSADAISPLGGREDEFAFLPELLEMAVDSGFAIVQVHEATLDEWDRFESGYTARYADWLASHPATHPSTPDVVAMARKQRLAYFQGYRGVLGMAYLALLAV